jgi:enamine deaminase RidA (YjgF/YER057c/UK114 family)
VVSEVFGETGFFPRAGTVEQAAHERAVATQRLRKRCEDAGWDLADVVVNVWLDTEDKDAVERNLVKFVMEARHK